MRVRSGFLGVVPDQQALVENAIGLALLRRHDRPKRRCRYNSAMPRVDQWSGVASEARWATELMDELLKTTTQGRDELSARANELRAQAAGSDVEGYRTGLLKLADRYEQTAAAARRASA